MSVAKLSGRVAVVTGAASGIGEAIAKLCVAQGARVVMVDKDAIRLEAAAKSIGGDAITLHADVGAVDTAARYVLLATEHFGRLDIAFLNAGIAGRVCRIDAVAVSDFDEVMRVNVRSVWSGIAALFPVMQAAGGGSIVVTASTGGVQGAPMVAPYVASKHAVIGLVKSAALEGARYNIRVNAVAPAPIDTPMMAHIASGLGRGDSDRARTRTLSHIPMRRYGGADEVARMMLFLASDDSSYSTGAVFLSDGGSTAGISL
jgi:NAD(P)-dependent dehydrogenase (short-subunit alcohol dehydrogenase family)